MLEQVVDVGQMGVRIEAEHHRHLRALDRVDEELDALGAQLAAFPVEEVELRNQLETAQGGAKRLRHATSSARR